MIRIFLIQVEMIVVGAEVRIDVVGWGYWGGNQLGNFQIVDIENFGNGLHSCSGGSYVTLGGGFKSVPRYGFHFIPVAMGGGGSGGIFGARGGDGGGYIRLIADTLELNGAVLADGDDADSNVNADGVGGAGGSIYMMVKMLKGTGTIIVYVGDGGLGQDIYGGVGGAIVIVYDKNEGFDFVKVQVFGGSGIVVDLGGGSGLVVLFLIDGFEKIFILDNNGLVFDNLFIIWYGVGCQKIKNLIVFDVQVYGSLFMLSILVGW